MFKNGFLVVCRELSNVNSEDTNNSSKLATSVKVKYTEDLREAIGLQLGMLIGAPIEVCLATIKQETIDGIVENLNNVGRDRLSNGEGESFIFVMWGKK